MHNGLIEIVKKHLTLLNAVEHVYLFGSVLVSNDIVNDIDVFIVYSEYNDVMQKQINKFKKCIENESEIPVDLTILSFIEEKQVCFLEKIKSLQLK